MNKPVSQGGLDGLCGCYSVVNALSLLFPHAMNEERRESVFKVIAKACPKGLDILFDGTTVNDVRHMLHAARNKLLIESIKFDWEQPFSKTTFKTFDDFCRELRWRIEGDDAFSVVGISKPWSHWTVAKCLTPHEMLMDDSCHVKQIPLGKCGLTGDGTDYEFDYRQTFTLMRSKK